MLWTIFSFFLECAPVISRVTSFGILLIVLTLMITSDYLIRWWFQLVPRVPDHEKGSAVYSTGVINRNFYPIYNIGFDHLEAMLTIHRPKTVLSGGSLCGLLVPILQSTFPKRTFILRQKYHTSDSNRLS